MHFLGLSGMPRRIPEYPNCYTIFNKISTIGSITSLVGILFFIAVLFYSCFNSKLKNRTMLSVLSNLMLEHFNTPFLELNNIYATQYTFNDPATSFVAGIIDLHHTIFFYLIIVSSIVLYLLFYLLFFGSSTKNKHSYFNHNTGLEVIWTLLPSVIVSLILLPSLSVLHAADEILDPSITVKIVGHQWYWSYEYSDNSLKNLENNLNFDSHIKANWLNVLAEPVVVLPVQTNIRFLITSDDVIHSWSLPAWGIKMDAIPGRVNQVMLSITKPGLFYGQCSEICGVGHGFMPITIEAVSNFQYLEWLMQKNYILSNLVSSQTLPYSDSGAIEAISSRSLISHDNPKLLLFLNHWYDGNLPFKNMLPENEDTLDKIKLIDEYFRCCVFNKGLNNIADDINAEELNAFLKTDLVKLSTKIIKDFIFDKAINVNATPANCPSIFEFLGDYKTVYDKNPKLYDGLVEIDSLTKQALNIIESKYYNNTLSPLQPTHPESQLQIPSHLNCENSVEFLQSRTRELEKIQLEMPKVANDLFKNILSQNELSYEVTFSLFQLLLKRDLNSGLEPQEEMVLEAANLLYKSYQLRLAIDQLLAKLKLEDAGFFESFMSDECRKTFGSRMLQKILDMRYAELKRLHIERDKLLTLFNENYLSPFFKKCFNNTSYEHLGEILIRSYLVIKSHKNITKFVEIYTSISEQVIASNKQSLEFMQKICKYDFSCCSERPIQNAQVYSVYNELNGDESFYDSEMLLKKCIHQLDDAILKTIKNSEVSGDNNCQISCLSLKDLLQLLNMIDQNLNLANSKHIVENSHSLWLSQNIYNTLSPSEDPEMFISKNLNDLLIERKLRKLFHALESTHLKNKSAK